MTGSFCGAGTRACCVETRLDALAGIYRTHQQRTEMSLGAAGTIACATKIQGQTENL